MLPLVQDWVIQFIRVTALSLLAQASAGIPSFLVALKHWLCNEIERRPAWSFEGLDKFCSLCPEGWNERELLAIECTTTVIKFLGAVQREGVAE